LGGKFRIINKKRYFTSSEAKLKTNASDPGVWVTLTQALTENEMGVFELMPSIANDGTLIY